MSSETPQGLTPGKPPAIQNTGPSYSVRRDIVDTVHETHPTASVLPASDRDIIFKVRKS